jgi:hypothetical protein
MARRKAKGRGLSSGTTKVVKTGKGQKTNAPRAVGVDGKARSDKSGSKSIKKGKKKGKFSY